MKRTYLISVAVLALVLLSLTALIPPVVSQVTPVDYATAIESSSSYMAKLYQLSTNLGLKFTSPSLVTNLNLAVDTTSTGIASGDVLAPMLEIRNAVRFTRGTGILKSLIYAAGDNNAPAVRLLITSQPILDWPLTNAVMSFNAFTNNPYVLGGVDITTADFRPWGTNYYATKDVSIGIKAATNSIFIYAGCSGAITNTNSAQITPTILQD